MITAIVDYGSGNLRSIAKSCEKAAQYVHRAKVIVSSDSEVIARADRIILPGVGAFADCAAGIQAIPGMHETLVTQVIKQGKPFLGVCVGMQLMADKGYEHGEHAGLGWISGEVVPIIPKDPRFKVPHMGWNELRLTRHNHPVLQGIKDGDHAYFVHSFRFACQDPENILVEVEYAMPIVAALAKANMVGTQFHPEKSQETGLKLLVNFMQWQP